MLLMLAAAAAAEGAHRCGGVLLCGLELCGWQGVLPVQDVVHQVALAAWLGAHAPCWLEAHLQASRLRHGSTSIGSSIALPRRGGAMGVQMWIVVAGAKRRLWQQTVHSINTNSASSTSTKAPISLTESISKSRTYSVLHFLQRSAKQLPCSSAIWDLGTPAATAGRGVRRQISTHA